MVIPTIRFQARKNDFLSFFSVTSSSRDVPRSILGDSTFDAGGALLITQVTGPHRHSADQLDFATAVPLPASLRLFFFFFTPIILF